MKPVILTSNQWQQIRSELHKEYPKTVFLLRNKMKTVLGFSVREHKAWIENKTYSKDYSEWEYRMAHPLPNRTDPFLALDWEPPKGNTEYQIHLDFYSERKRSMFLLKFSEIISRS